MGLGGILRLGTHGRSSSIDSPHTSSTPSSVWSHANTCTTASLPWHQGDSYAVMVTLDKPSGGKEEERGGSSTTTVIIQALGHRKPPLMPHNSHGTQP